MDIQLVQWDMSCDFGLCNTHFSGEHLEAMAHVLANDLYLQVLLESLVCLTKLLNMAMV
jgi:hypothetical protein